MALTWSPLPLFALFRLGYERCFTKMEKFLTTARIKSTVPVLASLDLKETLDFYTVRLGFEVRGQFEDHAIVSRDDAEIHFWKCKDRHIAENTSCYVRTSGIQVLYEEFTRRGLIVKQPVIQPWGMKELYVIDPHGNLLKFGEPE
jgi:catechol 2,3-dioxygenase-like lactoylglutathione lyase family enzyme